MLFQVWVWVLVKDPSDPKSYSYSKNFLMGLIGSTPINSLGVLSSIRAWNHEKSGYITNRLCTSVNKNVGNWHEIAVKWVSCRYRHMLKLREMKGRILRPEGFRTPSFPGSLLNHGLRNVGRRESMPDLEVITVWRLQEDPDTRLVCPIELGALRECFMFFVAWDVKMWLPFMLMPDTRPQSVDTHTPRWPYGPGSISRMLHRKKKKSTSNILNVFNPYMQSATKKI
jgi:hypothetical protein